MQPSTIDRIMLTTEQASQQVPSKQEGWVNIDQLKRVATYNGTGYGYITSKNLNLLVDEGRLVRKVKGTVAYWRPVRSGAPAFGGTNVFLEPTYPQEPYYPPGQTGDPTTRGQDGGKTPSGDEWVDTRYLAAGVAGGASGAASSAASGTVRGVISQIM